MDNPCLMKTDIVGILQWYVTRLGICLTDLTINNENLINYQACTSYHARQQGHVHVPRQVMIILLFLIQKCHPKL